MMKTPFCEIRDLSVKRGTFSLLVPRLEIFSSEIHLLTGPSGCGKSTLLQAISGFVKPEAGKILVKGEDFAGVPPEQRKMAYVFQQGALFPNMNVLENVAFSLRVRGVSKKERTLAAERWLDRVGLKSYSERSVDELSGGEAQRVQFARALITEFPLLLLDEPFSSLDQHLKNDLRDLLRELVRETGVACLLVTHDPEDKKRTADLYSEMKMGKIMQTERLHSV